MVCRVAAGLGLIRSTAAVPLLKEKIERREEEREEGQEKPARLAM